MSLSAAADFWLLEQERSMDAPGMLHALPCVSIQIQACSKFYESPVQVRWCLPSFSESAQLASSQQQCQHGLARLCLTILSTR